MEKAIPNKRLLNNIIIESLAKRAVKERPKPYLVWDTKQRALAVQVRPSGGLFWKVIYRRNGRPCWFTLGNAADLDVGDARDMALDILNRVAKGEDPQNDKMAQRSEGTFRELYEGVPKRDGDGKVVHDEKGKVVYDKPGYLPFAQQKNKSWKQAERLVRTHLMPRWKMLRPATISRRDVRLVLSPLGDKPRMFNAVLSATSAIFSWAVDEDLLKTNPCAGIKLKETESRERTLSNIEIQKFWRAFEEEGIAGLALHCILLLGQRPGEISRMRNEHLEYVEAKDENGKDVIGWWWELPGNPVPALRWPGTKNKRPHRVFIPAAAHDILAAVGRNDGALRNSLLGADGFVFGGVRGGPVVALDKVMRRICKALDVPRATPHDLRRTHGTLITTLGYPSEMMDRIENHKKAGVTGIYNRYEYGHEKKAIMETVAAHIMAVVDGKKPAKNTPPKPL